MSYFVKGYSLVTHQDLIIPSFPLREQVLRISSYPLHTPFLLSKSPYSLRRLCWRPRRRSPFGLETGPYLFCLSYNTNICIFCKQHVYNNCRFLLTSSSFIKTISRFEVCSLKIGPRCTAGEVLPKVRQKLLPRHCLFLNQIGSNCLQCLLVFLQNLLTTHFRLFHQMLHFTINFSGSVL